MHAWGSKEDLISVRILMASLAMAIAGGVACSPQPRQEQQPQQQAQNEEPQCGRITPMLVSIVLAS
jgi:hypothetical protein